MFFSCRTAAGLAGGASGRRVFGMQGPPPICSRGTMVGLWGSVGGRVIVQVEGMGIHCRGLRRDLCAGWPAWQKLLEMRHRSCNVISRGLGTEAGSVLNSSSARQEDLTQGSDKMADKDPEETSRLAAIEQCPTRSPPSYCLGPRSSLVAAERTIQCQRRGGARGAEICGGGRSACSAARPGSSSRRFVRRES